MRKNENGPNANEDSETSTEEIARGLDKVPKRHNGRRKLRFTSWSFVADCPFQKSCALVRIEPGGARCAGTLEDLTRCCTWFNNYGSLRAFSVQYQEQWVCMFNLSNILDSSFS